MTSKPRKEKSIRQLVESFMDDNREVDELVRNLQRRENRLIRKLLDLANNTNNEMLHYSRTKIPRCPTCKKNMARVSKHEWKPNCKCCKAHLFIG